MSHEKFEEHLRKTLSGHSSKMNTDAFWAALERKRKRRRRIFFIWFPIGLLGLGLTTYALWPTITSTEISQLDQNEISVNPSPKDPAVAELRNAENDLIEPEIKQLGNHTTEAPDNQTTALADLTGQSENRTTESDKGSQKTEQPNQPKAARKPNNPNIDQSVNHRSPEVDLTSKGTPYLNVNDPDAPVIPVTESDRAGQATGQPANQPTEQPIPEGINEHIPKGSAEGEQALKALKRLFFEVEYENTFQEKPIAGILFEAETPATPKWTYALGFHLGAGAAINQLSSLDSLAQDLYVGRQESEKSLEVLSGGVDVYLQHRKGFGIRTGLHLQQFGQKLSYSKTTERVFTDSLAIIRVLEYPDGTTEEVIGSVDVIETETRNVEHYNYYSFLEIPIALSYQFRQEGKLRLSLDGGASMNIWKSAKGQIVDENSLAPEFIGPEFDRPAYFKSFLLPELFGGIGLNLELEKGLELWARPQFRYRLGNVLPDNYPLEQKMGSINLQVGLKWSL